MLVGQSGARSTSSYSLFSVPLVSRIEGSRQHGCKNFVGCGTRYHLMQYFVRNVVRSIPLFHARRLSHQVK